MEEDGIVFDIKRFALHDGPGIRTTVFLKGCPLDCWWCHNPESKELNPEEITIDNVNYSAKKIIGQKMSVSEVIYEVMKDQIFYEVSNGGVTISGGEPFVQFDFLLSLVTKCKKHSLHVALDTAGCTTLEKVIKITPLIDLFLFDIKVLSEEKHLKFTGVSNKQILANLHELRKITSRIVIRIPIIPTVNDNTEEIQQIGKYLASENISNVELLPYHTIGEHKYLELQKINRMKDIPPPTKEQLLIFKEQLVSFDLHVKIEE